MKICFLCEQRFESTTWECPDHHHPICQEEDLLMFAPDKSAFSESYDPIHFSQLMTLESKNYWFCSRNRLIIWILQHYLPETKNFLEIGCGTGFVLSGIRKAFPNLDLSGSEMSKEGLIYARQRLPGINLFQMDARKIPFENEFDCIGAFDVLEHILEDKRVLSQMSQATRIGGSVLITVPQHSFLWSPFDTLSHHVRRYARTELKEKLEQAGFRVIKMISFMSLLFPLMVISRWTSRFKIHKKNDVTYWIRVGKLTNFIFENILKFEQVLIRLNVSFPVGGSLLAIARKER